MESLGEYVISLSCASVAAGIVLSLIGNSEHESLIRLLCGIFLTITALSPFTDLQILDFSELTQSSVTQASQATALGKKMAAEAMAEIIKEEMEAYILDKAIAWTSELEVSVQLSDGIPISVELDGDITPEGKQILSQMIADELGISKENQQWTGEK